MEKAWILYSPFSHKSSPTCLLVSWPGHVTATGGREEGGGSGHFRSKGATSRHMKTRPNSSHCRDQVNICSNCLEQSHDHKNLTRNKCNESVITILAISIHYNWSVDCNQDRRRGSVARLCVSVKFLDFSWHQDFPAIQVVHLSMLA